MENASKALGIAGGVLIALIILASLIYAFRRMSQIPEQQNYQKELAQITEFNEQYEAYNKNLMYGVDVVSCLNKVIDNNERSKKYTDGKYNIDISITINSDVEDKVEIYCYNNKGKEVRKFNCSIGSFEDIFGKITEFEISSITENTEVKSPESGDKQQYPSKMPKGTYNSTDNWKILNDLSKSTVNLKKVATNSKGNIQEWSKAIWYTAAYDFKNKKFTCEGIKYDNEGRVKSISFVEK